MKKIMLLFVFVLAGISTVLSQSIPYTDTGSKEGKILMVEVTGNNSVPIILKRGTHAIFTVKFRALKTIVNGSIKLNGKMYIGNVPVPLRDVFFDSTPPLILEGSEYTIYIRVNVLLLFPVGVIDLELYLENQNGGERVISFKVPAKIVN